MCSSANYKPRKYSGGHFHGDGCGCISIERLNSWGVDTIFGLPGDGTDSEFAALRKHQRKLKPVDVAK
jgi:hypothetical protein